MRASVVKGNMQKTITLQELERSSSNSVYVLNNSSDAKRGRGDILFSMPRQDGGEDVVRVPKTWIPVDLTDQVEKPTLLRSSRFRRVVSSDMVTLLHPDYAEKMLESEAAQEEKERLDNEREAARAMLAANPTTPKDEDEDEDETPQQRRRKEAQNKREESEGGTTGVEQTTAKFDLLLGRLQGEGNQIRILNALRNEGPLTRKQLKKVLKTFASLSKVVAWAEKRLED